MPDVRFIQLDAPKKDLAVCHQTRSLYNQNMRVMLHTQNPEHAQHLDQLLWSFSPTSFIPHAIYPCDLPNHPIVISHEEIQLDGMQALVLASPCSFEFMRTFPVVIDFAEVYDNELKKMSRQRFKQWKEIGFPPQFEKP